MSTPGGRRPRGRAGAAVAVVVLGVLALLDVVVLAGLAVLVVRSATAPGPGEPGYGSVDPHGYGLLLGSVLLVVGAVVLLALVVPLVVLARRLRRP